MHANILIYIKILEVLQKFGLFSILLFNTTLIKIEKRRIDLKTLLFNFKVDSTSKTFFSLMLLLYIYYRVAEIFLSYFTHCKQLNRKITTYQC